VKCLLSGRINGKELMAKRERIIGKDKFGTEVWIIPYPDGHAFDLQTDGRVFLTPMLARKLAKKLTEFANKVTAKGTGR
jgi:hypothetical protein